jgi:GDP-L-fucose synthase
MNKILVTGGSSMVGRHLQKYIPEAKYLSSKDCDLKDPEAVKILFNDFKPNLIIHLAAKVGGIMDNINNPANFFDDNILINTNVVKYAHESGCKNLISILSTCIYPDHCESYPLREEDLHIGPPTKTNFAYGYAKRAMSVQIDAYNKQYNTNYSCIIPCNLYSEYDHFEGDKAHFVSSLINKIHDAKLNNKKQITLFGSGSVFRQFMYADDLAKAISSTTYAISPFTYNVCNPENKTIKEIAEIAIKCLDADGLEICWDTSKPDGQIRKDACSQKFIEHNPKFTFTSLEEGIRKTYEKKYINIKN